MGSYFCDEQMTRLLVETVCRRLNVEISYRYQNRYELDLKWYGY